ncbi:calcium ATPase, partial [Aphelenchoides avenae]
KSKLRKEAAADGEPWPTVADLRQLMEARGADAFLKLNNDFGGVDGLCAQLRVDPVKGLPTQGSELAQRRSKYGANTIPRTTSKSFLRLVFDASR